MKIKYFFSILLFGALAACNSSGNKKIANTIDEIVLSPSKLVGSFVGAFGDNKITLLITRASGDTVEGRSIVGGNDRPFTGAFKNSGDVFSIVAKEPGDDKYDGVFNLTVNAKQPDVVTGTWEPNSPNANLGAKTFSLQRKAFVYSKDVGDYTQASVRLLKEEDVENLTGGDLELMRNEIFARHGYCFRKKELREMFEDKDWYVPNTVDVKKDLSEIEKKNIVLIKKYEKYAAENGDDFGR